MRNWEYFRELPHPNPSPPGEGLRSVSVLASIKLSKPFFGHLILRKVYTPVRVRKQQSAIVDMQNYLQ